MTSRRGQTSGPMSPLRKLLSSEYFSIRLRRSLMAE